MTQYRPLLLILVSLGLAGLVWMDNRGARFGGGKDHIVATRAAGNSPAADTPDEHGTTAKEAEEADQEKTALEEANQLLSGNPLASFDKSTLKNWVNRPLFAPSRQPPKKTAKGTVQKPPPPPDYKLLGVVLNRHRTIALLKSQGSGADFRVEVGDMIGGWHVAMVEKDSVTLKRDGEEAQKVKFAKGCSSDSDDDSC
jgi:general secretion pathway protein N